MSKKNDTPLVKRAYNLGLKAVPNFLSLSEELIKYYEKNLDQLPEAILRGFVLPKQVSETVVVEKENFSLLVDLGTITVPEDYDHKTQLSSFYKRNSKRFYYYNDDITDENFSNPSRILKPGEVLHVCAFQQVVDGTTTSEERMDFLLKQPGAVFVGAQGASLVFEEKRNLLPKGKWYSSFDHKARLWKDSGGGHGVPFVSARSDGGFDFDLGCFEKVWYDYSILLSFCNKSLEPLKT